MNLPRALILSAGLVAVLPAAAQESFDACTILTQDDVEKVLGTSAAGEPVNPKVKRPKVVPNCTYNASKDGKSLTATAQFRFMRTPDEAARGFEDSRMQLQTKPLILPGAEAFWSAKTGQLYLRKGRAQIALLVGPAKPNERDVEQAKKLAELVLRKL